MLFFYWIQIRIHYVSESKFFNGISPETWVRRVEERVEIPQPNVALTTQFIFRCMLCDSYTLDMGYFLLAFVRWSCRSSFDSRPICRSRAADFVAEASFVFNSLTTREYGMISAYSPDLWSQSGAILVLAQHLHDTLQCGFVVEAANCAGE